MQVVYIENERLGLSDSPYRNNKIEHLKHISFQAAQGGNLFWCRGAERNF